jgi:glycerol-3-phosphate dehydrogenase
MFFDVKWVQTWKEPVLNYMTSYFKWDDARMTAYKEELNQYIREATQVVEVGGAYNE